MRAPLRVSAVFVLAACAQPAPPPAASPVPPSLHTAHDAWVSGDLAGLTAAVHATLAGGPSPQAADNAIDLLAVALDHHGRLPTDQALPPGVARLSLDHVHRAGPDGHRYRLVASAWVDGPDLLDDLRLVGPHVDADRRSATWSVTPEDGGHFVELELIDTPAPAAPGLYTLHLIHGDEATTLWTVLPPLDAREAPTVASPTPGAVLSTATPTVTLAPDGVDPAVDGFGLWISQVPTYAGVWSRWSEQPIDSVTVEPPLADGRYWLAVSTRTVRQLGPVTLGQVERRGVVFEVDSE